MNATVEVRARIAPNVKNQAMVVLEAMGLTMSDFIRMSLTKVAQDKALPFDVFKPNAKTLAAIEDARAGRNMKRFESVDELMADLYDDEED